MASNGQTLATAYVKILPSMEGVEGEIKKTLTDEVSDAGDSGGKGLASKIKSAIVKLGIGAVIGKTIKEGFDQGAALEQSVGGIETLFGGAAEKMKAYAKDAYANAGMSANEYMEQATGFAASLVSSCGGDTQKAAETANIALQDMSDNANKMGTDMDSIQMAYQGFAKQNYTMLDNLKLGYGGTKSEMERLLSDAQKITGVKYDISNLDDVYQAIHVIQGDLKITGTTAHEAGTTFSGSFQQMKAAAENLMGYMAVVGEKGMEQFDVSGALSDLMETVKVFLFDNAIPMLSRFISQAIPVLVQGIINAVPLIIDAGKTLIQSLGQGMAQQFPALSGIFNNLLPIIEGVGVAFGSWKSAKVALDTVSLIKGTFSNVSGLFSTFAGSVVSAGGGIKGVVSALSGLAGGPIGLVVAGLTALVLGFIALYNNCEWFRDGVNAIWAAIVNFTQEAVANIQQFFADLGTSLSNTWNTISTMASSIWNNITGTIGNSVSSVVSTVQNLWNSTASFVTGVWNGLVSTASSVWNAITSTITGIATGIQSSLASIWNSISSTAANVWNGITGTARSVWNGIKSAIETPISTARDVVRNAIESIKGFFRFSISWPHIPMPHFGISPSGWQIGDLLKGSIPSLSIEWYAKAMDNPFLFTKPTVFGVGTGLVGAGEAGNELMYGHDSLMRDIEQASGSGRDEIIDALEDIVDRLADLEEAFKASKIEMNGRELGRVVRSLV